MRDLLRDVLREDFRGTFAPFLRASFKPIAIACFRLRTLRPEPLLSVPRLRRRIVDSTFFDADLPYLAISPSSRATDVQAARHGPRTDTRHG